MSAGLEGKGTAPEEGGVYGEAALGDGVRGLSHASFKSGVIGVNDNTGPEAGPGVYGQSNGSGVIGESSTWMGVYGKTSSTTGGAGVMGQGSGVGAGVFGENPGGDGVVGHGRRGVVGQSDDFQGVYGHSVSNAGVVGESDHFDGVFGVSHDPSRAGVSGHNPGGLAGFFDGDVVVTGDVRLAGADYAEQFDLTDRMTVEPGTVMVLDDFGALQTSDRGYDQRVAGVISGAGAYRPAVVMDSRLEAGETARAPVALVGKVYCKVDGTGDPIAVGDLLTTSDTPGHAMKAQDRARAAGAILGKALAPSRELGLIPVLVTLQ